MKGLDDYLQDVKQCCVLEVNCFDDSTNKSMNMLPHVEATEQKKESSLCRFQSAKKESAEEEEVEVDTLESARLDSGHTP